MNARKIKRRAMRRHKLLLSTPFLRRALARFVPARHGGELLGPALQPACCRPSGIGRHRSHKTRKARSVSKVLFLDFDGVLHAISGPGPDMRQFVWLPILKDLIAGRQDVRIVIHASYRRTSPAGFLREQLGFGKDVCLGVTNPHLERWESIVSWMQEHPWVDSCRILDDQAREFPDPPPPQLILCDGRRGLSEERVQAALKDWLNPDVLREWDRAPMVGRELDGWR